MAGYKDMSDDTGRPFGRLEWRTLDGLRGTLERMPRVGV